MSRTAEMPPVCGRLLALSVLLLSAWVGAADPAVATKPHRQAYKQGVKAMEQLQWDWAVVHLQRAYDLKPTDRDYEAALRRAKFQASYQHFERAKQHLFAGNLEAAIAELQQTVALNPSHQYAYVELEKALDQWRQLQEAEDAEIAAFEEGKRRAIRDLAAPPKLDPTGNIPIIWDMEEATIGDIFGVVRDVANINVIFDEGVRIEEKTDFVADNVTLEGALDLLMLKLGLVYKVYNDHTILVFPDNQTKRREYEDQVIQTFYLSNAEVKDVNALLRGVVDIRKTAVNEQLNAITILDTQDKIAIAGRLIERNDKAKAELIIDLEILEVNRTKLKNWGIDLTTGGEAGGLRGTVAFDDDQVRLNNLRRLGQLGSWVLSPIPSVVITLIKSDSDTRTLSRPQARVTDGEKVTVHIGDQVPIPNTTFNTSNTAGGNIVPVTSFTYQNVGIQINLEPRVHHNREITLKMQTEISAVGSISAGGQPTIGTREIETVIRLRDGETNLLAGLFSETSQSADGGIPGLMDVPLLRRIFGNHQRQSQESEIILTVTPHIIRIPDIGTEDLGPLAVGTDKDRRLRGESRYGVGGSPFRDPNEKPPETLFSSLSPGGTTLDTTTVVNPDLDLASGRGRPGQPMQGADDASESEGGSPQGAGPGSTGTPTGTSGETSGAPPPPASGAGGTGPGGTAPGGTDPGGISPGGTAPGGTGPGGTGPGGTSPGGTGPGGTSPGGTNPGGSGAGGTSPGGSGVGGTSSGGSGGPSGPSGVSGAATGPVQLFFRGPAQASVGATFDVDILVDTAGRELSDAPYHVLFDPALVEVLSVSEGGFFINAGAQSVFLPNVSSGRVLIGHSMIGRGSAPTGAGTLARLSLRALAPGTARLSFAAASLSDRMGDSHPLSAGGYAVLVLP